MPDTSCAAGYCLKSSNAWLSSYTITIEADRFTLEPLDEGNENPEPGGIAKWRIPYGATILINNADAEVHEVQGGRIPFSLTVNPSDESVLVTGFKAEDQPDPTDPWKAVIGVHTLVCPLHLDPIGVPTKQAQITIFNPMGYDLKGCDSGCRTSVAMTGRARYIGFQDFTREKRLADGGEYGEPRVYPQFKTLQRTTDYDVTTPPAFFDDPGGKFVTNDTRSPAKEVYTRHIKDRRLQLTSRDTYDMTGPWCELHEFVNASSVSEDGTSESVMAVEVGEWNYESITRRKAELYWHFYVTTDGGQTEVLGPVHAGWVIEEYLDAYLWDEFARNFNTIYMLPSAFSSSPDTFKRVAWPYTEYEAQFAIYTDDNCRYIVKDGVQCDLCAYPGFDNFNADDHDFCMNSQPQPHDFQMGYEECQIEENGDDPGRCDQPDLIEGLASPLWTEPADPASISPSDPHVNQCATEQMNQLSGSYILSPDLHYSAMILLEVGPTGRYIEVTKRVVKNWWSGPYVRTVVQSIDGTETVRRCKQRLFAPDPADPFCQWVDDPSQSDLQLGSATDVLLTTNWALVESDLLPGITSSSVRSIEVRTECPKFDLQGNQTNKCP